MARVTLTSFFATSASPASPVIAPERSSQTTSKPYPTYKVIVLDDDVNTFEHVHDCLMTYIPGMSSDRAWELTNQVHFEGQAIVWVGPQEQAELYHQQLSLAGLTMAPLEAA
ncbi:MAG TPA: ATP-dependent Clp protease adapter ClpS [Coleofasciculaceae cyanobacterium]